MRYFDTGSRDPTQTLGAWLAAISPTGIQAFRFQSGYFSVDSLPFLRPILEALQTVSATAKCVIGANPGATTATAVQALANALGLPRPSASLTVCAFHGGLFHPKVVHIVRCDGSQIAYVGSANITGNGIRGTNIEAGVVLDTEQGDSVAELQKIADAIDVWSSLDEHYQVANVEDVGRLLEANLLALDEETAPDLDDHRPPAREGRHRLSPIFRLPTPPPDIKSPAPLTPVLSPNFLLVELSKNRGSKGTFQADVGQDAHQNFFGGQIGGRTEIAMRTHSPNGTVSSPRTRQLVDVRSSNFRVEIDFHGAWPGAGQPRPLVLFRREGNEFGVRLFLPGDADYGNAAIALTSLGGTPRKKRMRRVPISRDVLAQTWPSCPLL